MGLGQSNSSEPETAEKPEERQEDDENVTLEEESRQPNSYRREWKNFHVRNNQKFHLNHARHPSQNKSGATNTKLIHELHMDKIIEEKNCSERIIREKEKLIREREETIRQQADLIKSQSDLLGQRKLMSQSNIDLAKVHYDVIFKPRILKPAREPTQFSGSIASHEIVRSNGHSDGPENLCQVISDNDCGKKYFFDPKPILPTRHEQSNQIFNLPSPVTINPLGVPFRNSSNSSPSAVPYQPTYYASHTPYFNVPPPNIKATPTMLTRTCHTNDCRRSNIRTVELRDDVARQSTNQLLEDLDKQTNYELRNLNNVQNGNSSSDSFVDVKKSSGDRKLKPVKSFHGIFKCSGCSVTWKSKMASIGASRKCKKCGCDVVRLMDKNWKSDDDKSRSQNLLKSKSESISDVG